MRRGGVTVEFNEGAENALTALRVDFASAVIPSMILHS